MAFYDPSGQQVSLSASGTTPVTSLTNASATGPGTRVRRHGLSREPHPLAR